MTALYLALKPKSKHKPIDKLVSSTAVLMLALACQVVIFHPQLIRMLASATFEQILQAEQGTISLPFLAITHLEAILRELKQHSESDTERSIARVLRKVVQPLPITATAIDIEQADSIHALRHWYANRLQHVGESIADISRLLGHSSPRTTINSYLHELHLSSPARLATNRHTATPRLTIKQVGILCGVSRVRVRALLKADGTSLIKGTVAATDATKLLSRQLSVAHNVRTHTRTSSSK